jgi:hydroxymethylbilane synthase
MNPIRLGTRGSDLALTQTRLVADALRAAHPGLVVETRIIQTSGDRRLDVSLSAPGALGKGLFTKELEDALLARTIDAAVHSLKDLPTEQPAGLTLGAILRRADPSDTLVSKTPGGLAGLPPGACVATSSPRRKAQLLRLRSDLRVADIRGNVPTRLRKLADDPSLHALLLAQAGLDRLGPGVVPPGLHVTVVPEILPAPGQGALAVECRADDTATLRLLRAVHHEETALCVGEERRLLHELGGGCSLPFAALAVMENGRLSVRTFWESDDPPGTRVGNG